MFNLGKFTSNSNTGFSGVLKTNLISNKSRLFESGNGSSISSATHKTLNRFCARKRQKCSSVHVDTNLLLDACLVAKQQKLCADFILLKGLKASGAAGPAHLDLAKPTLLLSLSKTV